MSNQDQSISKSLKALNAKPMTAEQEKASEIISATAFARPKYLKAQNNLTKLKIQRFRKSHPNWELKDILAAIIKEYPADMPSSVISTMVQFIISEWERLVVPEEVV